MSSTGVPPALRCSHMPSWKIIVPVVKNTCSSVGRNIIPQTEYFPVQKVLGRVCTGQPVHNLPRRRSEQQAEENLVVTIFIWGRRSVHFVEASGSVRSITSWHTATSDTAFSPSWKVWHIYVQYSCIKWEPPFNELHVPLKTARSKVRILSSLQDLS